MSNGGYEYTKYLICNTTCPFNDSSVKYNMTSSSHNVTYDMVIL